MHNHGTPSDYVVSLFLSCSPIALGIRRRAFSDDHSYDYVVNIDAGCLSMVGGRISPGSGQAWSRRTWHLRDNPSGGAHESRPTCPHNVAHSGPAIVRFDHVWRRRGRDQARFVYKVLGIQEFTTESDVAIPAGTHQVRAEFAYDGGGLAKGGDVTL
jgi:hypothetical protein